MRHSSGRALDRESNGIVSKMSGRLGVNCSCIKFPVRSSEPSPPRGRGGAKVVGGGGGGYIGDILLERAAVALGHYFLSSILCSSRT